MGKLKALLLSGLLILSLKSCFFPCNLGYGGKVVDEVTDEPIDSVLIKYYNGGNYLGEILTDSTGEFFVNGETHSIFIGGKCKELKLVFFKSGYESLDVSTTTGEIYKTIRLTK
jgi:hypothetical protein